MRASVDQQKGMSMAVIAPLRGIRYPQQNQTAVVAPPYDVLSGEDKARLLAKDAHNIVAVDLPHIPPKNAGPDAAYEGAAATLKSWLASGVLRQDDKPAIYAYQQTYSAGKKTYKRRGFFCRVQLEDFGTEGTIHPHEQTFSGPKEDRLKLVRATKANLSPVFGLYDDPTNDVTDLLFEAVNSQPGAKPLATADLPSQDGKSTVTSELWAVTDPAVIADVTEMMAAKHLYIADGHHRYTTSLNYRKELEAARGSGGGALAKDDPANYALFVCIAMQDPGLIILPTHRVVAAGALDGFYLEKFREVAEKLGSVVETQFRGDNLHALEQALSQGSFGLHAIGVYDPVEDKAVVFKPKSDDPLKSDAALKDKSAAWRQLDVAILQHLVFERIIAPNFVKDKNVSSMTWAFPHEAHEVATMTRTGAGTQYRVGFLLQPTPLTAVRDLCNANELMPQKSTFFYPKLATGMVINSLA
jgi:uncharacterized protein (DUF1015 family)